MKNTRRGLSRLAVGMTLALAVAACSSEGGAQNQGGSNGGGDARAAGSVDTERYTVAMITHEAPGDTFWDKIRAGAEDAAQAHNVELRYSSQPEAPDQANLVQNAVDSDVDGIAVTLAYPEAVGPAVKSAADAGIPVVAFNSGISNYDQYDAMMYFGSNEQLAGRTVGERIAELGGQKAICVIQEQGHVALETRCDGVIEGFPNTERLYVEGTDAASVRQTIGAKLQQDPEISHIVTLGAPIAMIALQSASDAGSDAKVATFDLNIEAAQKIADGEIVFSVDQQPYVQGYLAVASLWLNLTNGNDIGGGEPVLTGPSIVDESNIDQILPYAQNNTR